MTTTELIKLLKENEFGGATGRQRDVDINIPGYGLFSNLEWSVDSTGDGLFTDITFKVQPGAVYPDEEAEDTIQQIGADYGMNIEGVRHAIEAYQDIICEITGGRLSKLTYDARFVLEEADKYFRWKYGIKENE